MTPIKVKKLNKKTGNSTNIQMMVQSDSEECFESFNKDFIVNSLVKEIELDKVIAEKIAVKAEQFLLKNELLNINTSFIRNIINYFLSQEKIDDHLKYNSLSLPTYDVKKLLEEHNSENSNTSFSPESINLAIAGQIQKQYALKEIFSKQISEAHLKGDIHLHDLDFPNRPYAFDGDLSLITIKRNDKTEIITIKELYERLKTTNIKEYQILDKTGYVELINLVELNNKKDIYEIELETGEKLFVTEDHPCLKYNDENNYIELQTKDLKVGDLFYAEINKR